MKKTLLTETIVKVLERRPVAFAYLVGSQATGRITPMSDVDVAVYFDRPKHKLAGLASGVATDLQGALGRPDVDVIELNRVGIPVLQSIMKSAMPIAVRDASGEKEFRSYAYRRIVDFQPTLELIGRRTLKNIRQEVKL